MIAVTERGKMLKPKNKKLLLYAKELRHNMTDQERKLWYLFLKEHEYKFYRQKPLGNYIADFYCHSAKMIIELDGGQHYEENTLSYDLERTAFFKKNGINVLRFKNSDIDKRFADVCSYIDLIVRKQN